MTSGPTSPTSSTVFLLLDAPFAAFRWLQAGVFRGTFPVIPPSAAWGLALNLASIETRGSVGEVVTPIRPEAPHLDIAVGVLRPGQRSSLYQQLHGYPVGNSGGDLQARARGQKYWIAPARRELVVGFQCVVGIRGPAPLLDRIPQGLAGTLEDDRYGLPFAGDNQFLFNRIDVVGPPEDARWYLPVLPGETLPGSTRLTTIIDRGDSGRTRAPLFAPTPTPCPCPAEAWVDVGPSALAPS
jgi:CRISPR-associated protein Cas5t